MCGVFVCCVLCGQFVEFGLFEVGIVLCIEIEWVVQLWCVVLFGELLIGWYGVVVGSIV